MTHHQLFEKWMNQAEWTFSKFVSHHYFFFHLHLKIVIFSQQAIFNHHVRKKTSEHHEMNFFFIIFLIFFIFFTTFIFLLIASDCNLQSVTNKSFHVISISCLILEVLQLNHELIINFFMSDIFESSSHLMH